MVFAMHLSPRALFVTGSSVGNVFDCLFVGQPIAECVSEVDAAELSQTLKIICGQQQDSDSLFETVLARNCLQA